MRPLARLLRRKNKFLMNARSTYVAIPLRNIPTLAYEYIAAMEVELSDDWCRCKWIIHPDDVEKPKGQRRKRRSDEASNCPVHTRAGLIIYFVEWMMKNGHCGTYRNDT